MQYKISGLICVILVTLGCKPTLQDIDFGHDQCAYCKMIISDRRYGAESVTAKGKVYKFDALECLLQDPSRGLDDPLIAAVPWDAPQTLSSVTELVYLISPEMPSPMGANLTSFTSREVAVEMLEAHGGRIYSWEELVKQMHNR